jgi:hypothetical protein
VGWDVMVCGPLGRSRVHRNLLSRDMKILGKAVPLQAWTGPEGSKRLRLPDFKTTGP